MDDKTKLAVQKLKDALESLKEGVREAKTNLGKDGVIQRFEFCFELAWKTIKIHMKEEGFEIKTPRESLQKAFQTGLIQNENNWLDMLKDRNRSSHIYDKKTSEDIFLRIKNIYLPEFENLLKLLEKS